ncbi:MAG: sel1 repeat family protein [Thermoguttaceae bacterium]|nr:sel1 repeat family protein [Thermoguttaceae bacterium]
MSYFLRNRLFRALAAGLICAGGMVLQASAQNAPQSTVNIAQLRAAAEQGDAESQLSLGMYYFMGEGGLKQSDADAIKWFQLAAKQKNYQAQYMLGIYCMEGRGIKKNEELGTKLILSAANGGFAEAQYEYASMLAEQNKMSEALPWMKKAVAQEYYPAFVALGSHYIATAKPGTPEMNQGIQLLMAAASEGDLDAQLTLGAALVEQKETAAGVVWLEVASMNGAKDVAEALKELKVSPEEACEIASVFYHGDGIIPKNYQKFKFWAEKSAAENYAGAQTLLGMYYCIGVNHELTPERGVEFLEKAAAQNDPEALTLLAICCRNGRGTAQDPKRAIELLQKAAKQNYAPAYTQLAFSSLFGSGIVSKEDVTRKLFQKAGAMNERTALVFMDYCTKNSLSFENGPALLKQIAAAAKAGDAQAQYLMGEIYCDGHGVKMDEKIMVAYYTMAVKQNYIYALTELSRLYEMGIYVKENRDVAIQLALKAAEQGDQQALSYLNSVGQVDAAEQTQNLN